MNILPFELINDSIDSYIANYSTASQKIYWVVIIVVVATLVTLPFIYVDVSVQESGIIRPMVEKTEIRATVTEWVDSVFVREGQILKQGDTILTFQQANPNFQIEYQQKRLVDMREHINDLTFLAKGQKPESFSSASRRQEYALFIQREQEQETNVSKAQKDWERNQTLYEKGVIAAEENENYRYNYDKERNVLASLKNSQISQWQNDLNTYVNSREEMKNNLNQQLKERNRYVVVSPVYGTLDQFKGIYKGSSIQSGSLLAIISPDSILYAEVYVSPRNIGYIYPGMPVNIQISSFNYNEWGTVPGKVTDISSDFLTGDSGNEPFYKVKCQLEKNCLVRKNGVAGKLKKGMNVTSHFMITERSLFSLIYQKMDDWANPAQYNNSQLAKK